MKICRLYCYFILIGLVTACSSAEDRENVTLPYFDLSGYIRDICSDSQRYQVEKSISLNGIVETQKIDNYPLWKDIKDFDAYDINRPALFDKYRIDTTQTGNIREITYQPLDDQLKVTLLKVSYEEDDLTSIQVKTATKSFLDNVELTIDWKPKTGYSLSRQSDKVLGKKSSQLVDVEIL